MVILPLRKNHEQAWPGFMNHGAAPPPFDVHFCNRRVASSYRYMEKALHHELAQYFSKVYS
jgi:hypothetical protein